MKQGCFTLFIILIIIQVEANICPDHFVSIGNFCYHFSELEETWDGAKSACAGIGSVIDEHTITAVLDLGTLRDNLLLLNQIEIQRKRYWLGGYLKREEDNRQNCGVNRWEWIYHQGMEIDLQANYWNGKYQPDTSGNCISTSNSRLDAKECSKRLKFICQIVPKEFGFKDIGGNKFYFSKENSISAKIWPEARNVCKSISPPEEFDFVDLAIVDDINGQELMKMILKLGTNVWLGGGNLEENNNNHNYNYNNLLSWIDGNEISQESYITELQSNYPFNNQPRDCTRKYYYYSNTYAKIECFSGRYRANLDLFSGYRYINSSTENIEVSSGCIKTDSYRREYLLDKNELFDFVCQAYKN